MRDRILREVPEKRERCVKHFQMTQKGMAAAVYPAPVHYEEDGQWKEIDNRLEPVQEDGREVYRNFASAVRVSFAKESDTKELVTIDLQAASPDLQLLCRLPHQILSFYLRQVLRRSVLTILFSSVWLLQISLVSGISATYAYSKMKYTISCFICHAL